MQLLDLQSRIYVAALERSEKETVKIKNIYVFSRFRFGCGMVKTSSGYKLLIAGGTSLKFGQSGAPIRSAHLYDLKTKRWSPAQSMPIPLLDMSSVQYGENLLFVGGSTSEAHTNYNNKIFEYNGVTNTWRQWTKGLKAGRRGCGIMVIGGEGIKLLIAFWYFLL